MQSSRAGKRVKAGTLQVLPQPVTRLMGVVLIGLGAGLYAAAAPAPVIFAALAASLFAVALVSAQAWSRADFDEEDDDLT